MRALCWHGKFDVRVDTVPDPVIQEPTDAIIKITSTAICGSDLHLYDGYMVEMEKGDVLGHEPMGIVVEVGSSVTASSCLSSSHAANASSARSSSLPAAT